MADKECSFEQVEFVFDALHASYHPEGIGDDGLDDRMHALWVLYLNSVGWTDDEFWEAYENQPDHKCPKCQAEAEEKAKTQVN